MTARRSPQQAIHFPRMRLRGIQETKERVKKFQFPIMGNPSETRILIDIGTREVQIIRHKGLLISSNGIEFGKRMLKWLYSTPYIMPQTNV
jgi:hypothetical protein